MLPSCEVLPPQMQHIPLALLLLVSIHLSASLDIEGSGIIDESEISSYENYLTTAISKDLCEPLSQYTNVSLAEDLEYRKLMGRWFVGLSSIHEYRRNNTCIMHYYTDLYTYNGSLQKFEITESFRDSKMQLQREKGSAYGKMYSHAPSEGMLIRYLDEWTVNEVPFWIYKLGPEGKDSFGRLQYEYFIASNCIKFPVLVLVRNPQIFKNKYKKEVLNWLDKNGFKIGKNNPLVQPDYRSCFYADSFTKNIVLLPCLSTLDKIPTIKDENGILVEVPATIESPVERQQPSSLSHNETSDANYCPENSQYYALADDLDMKRLMGRWFVGLTSTISSRECYLNKTFQKRCPMYEFGRLIRSRNAVTFDVTTKYRGFIGLESKDFGHAFSIGPRYAMMELKNDEFQDNNMDMQFWIYKVGPENEDSFGRLQYEYAIVSSCIRFPVLVLVRSTESFKDRYKKDILLWLKDNNFTISGLRQPAFYNCDYTDSFKEIMGE